MPGLDPSRLRPGEAVRLLNSTPLGSVVDGRRLRRHRDLAGYRIGDGATIDLFRYAAWLASRRLRSRPDAGESYEAHRERARARSASLSASGRDIGPIPAVEDRGRRARAEVSFRTFCEEYFPEAFTLAWSADHLKVITKIEQAVLHGGLFAMAMPRGSGKTTLAECACLWATLTGARDFVALIGSNEAHAAGMLESLKTELETNDRLIADFTEDC